MSGHEVTPRFLINLPSEDVTLFCPLPDDEAERSRRLNLVRTYMAAKLARGFVMSTELHEPDAISSVAVTRDGVAGGLRLIQREPFQIGQTIWLNRDQIGDDVPRLLPDRYEELSAGDMALLERAVRELG